MEILENFMIHRNFSKISIYKKKSKMLSFIDFLIFFTKNIKKNSPILEIGLD